VTLCVDANGAYPVKEAVRTTHVPAIVEGAIDLPDAPSLASLVDWSAIERLAF
jgi:hypothetical protein